MDDPAIEVFAKLSEIQLKRYFEPREGLFLAETTEVILRALDKGYEPFCLLLEEGKQGEDVEEVLRRVHEIPVYEAKYEVLKDLVGFPLTRGALCAMRRKPLPSIKDVLDQAKNVVVLEEVMNPTNIGAIFRSAAALGMDGVLLTKGCADPLYRRAIRVSMGTVFQIPWTFMDTELCDLDALKEKGFVSISAALTKETIPVDDPRLKRIEKKAVLLGSEKNGLAPKTIQSSDYTVRIPMFHGVDSLNVAAASAIVFWEMGKRDRLAEM